MERLRQSRTSAAKAALAAVVVASLLMAGVVSTRTAAGAGAGRAEAQASNRMWFWSRDNVQQTLRRNGIRWSNASDPVRVAKCAGLGHWIVARGVRMFRDFRCYIEPQDRAVYKIILHVVGQRSYRFTFARYQTKVDWWWPAQLAANSLVERGIRWKAGLQTLVASSCAAFGPSSRIRGQLYYELFYCTVTPARGFSYGVVLDVTEREDAHISFVTYSDELPVTPVDTTPVPSSNTTNAKIVQDLLVKQLSLEMLQQGNKQQSQTEWGRDIGPSGIDFILGSVGCASDPFDRSPFKSYGSC